MVEINNPAGPQDVAPPPPLPSNPLPPQVLALKLTQMLSSYSKSYHFTANSRRTKSSRQTTWPEP